MRERREGGESHPAAVLEDGPGSESPFTPADTDEVAAAKARVRYRTGRVEVVEADAVVRGLLSPGEVVFAVHPCVALNRRFLARADSALDRRKLPDRSTVVGSARGTLYVTNARLVHLGWGVFEFGLDEIEDSALAGKTLLLLMLRDGIGVALDGDRPRLLRVQIAAARARLAERRVAPR